MELTINSLTGYFLIATPQMPDPRFARKVIYMCSHELEEGAMGVVLNQPVDDVSLAALYESMNIPVPDMKLPSIFLGGPVEIEAVFILHSSDYPARQYIEINDKVRMSRDPQILQDIAGNKGPQDYRFFLGYSGWGPGQLEYELSQDGWLTLPADYEDIFYIAPEKMWKKITLKHGIDISLFGEVTGKA
ncbi:MAG: YqgE/AlgH family protein [Proteobacteria bacterium]|nr:YqgE/AlgH family protein [Pseudomonadota bacterium]MBU4298251.1 YqgE/AlgH family protein [Pseudomonadota bacterium]MCG2747519.1 YqgE/AlgH family protein [Desulfobulbaceae bacterium]